MAGEADRIRLLIRGAWERHWSLLGIQGLAAVMVVATFYAIPPKYSSSTTIRFEPETVLNPLTQGIAFSSQMEGISGTMRQELLSRKHIENVISYLGLVPTDMDPVEKEKLVYKMAKNIFVSVTTQSQRSTGASLFHISYEGKEPQLTKEVTETLASLFIDRTQALNRSESDAAYDFISQQLDIYKQKLENSENSLRSYEEQHIDELPESRNANITRLETLKTTLRDVQHRINQAHIQKDLLIKKIPKDPLASDEDMKLVTNPLVATLKEKEGELQDLKRRYSANYPDVISLKAEIEVLRGEIAQNPTVLASEVRRATPTAVEETVLNQLQQTDVEIESLSVRVPNIEREIADYERKVRGIPRSEQELLRLQRDYNVNSDIYEMFLRRLEEARVSRELEQAKRGEVLKIVEPANLPLVPTSPERKKFLLLAVAAGLLLNGVLLYVIFSKDTSFHSAHDAEEYLGLTVVARIPRVALGGERTALVLNLLSFATATAVYTAGLVAAFYWDKITTLFGAIT